MSIYLHNKRKHQVKDTKEWLQSELQTTLGVCFFNCPYKLNVKMKHGILPGHVIENLPFPFSCPVTEFHKDILAVQGHHQLKTLYFCVDVRMPLWQIHKWYSDTAEAKGRSKILHDDFMFLYLTKRGVSLFSSTTWTSWCGPQCLRLLKYCNKTLASAIYKCYHCFKP